jgi:hypothetical protein
MLIVALVCVAALSQSVAASDRASEVKECLNGDYSFRKTTWNHSIEDNELANLRVEAIWTSKRPQRFALTVVTQLSWNRMPALLNQCSTFTGPMAASVYLPIVQEKGDSELTEANLKLVQDEMKKIGSMHEEAERNMAGCQLDIIFLWEAFDTKDAALLYPVNSLRNYARILVKTQLMSAIDVDMMISRSLSEHLQSPGVKEILEEQALKRIALVLPAFEPSRQGSYGRSMADLAANGTKADLASLFKSKQVLQFKLKVFVRGHTPTNYTRWFASSDTYPVRYQRMYEPWFIGHVDQLPFHDALFRGYGLNKIAHVASLNYYNYSFFVHPAAWLIHRPHEDTAVRKVVAREASNVNKLGIKLPKTALYSKVTLLFGDAKRGMIRGTLDITLDKPLMKCFQKIEWLPKLPQLKGTPVDPSIFI